MLYQFTFLPYQRRGPGMGQICHIITFKRPLTTVAKTLLDSNNIHFGMFNESLG